jgi:hypothetical protein
MRDRVRTLVAGTILAITASCFVACHGRGHKPPQDAAADSAPLTTLTGTLQGGAAAVGHETTGWRLIGDGATGGFDVDVSKVQSRARELDGRRVTVAGRMVDRHWRERGTTQVLVAERIDAAAQRRP